MLLAIDTATRMLSLALHDGQRLRAESAWETANRHTVEVAPAVQEMCARAGIALRDLSVIAVSQGPGSFSGLRIGIGLAKGLALALQIPLIPVPTLDIVAAAQPESDRPLVAVAQAGRGRVCAGRYAWSGGRWNSAAPVEIVTWDALLASIDQPMRMAGEIDPALFERVKGTAMLELAPPALSLRRAGILADLGWACYQSGETAEAAAVVPIYVNQPGVPHP